MKAKYIKTKLSTLINVTKIVTIHYNEYGKNFNFGGESHDFWEMVYVDKGRVLVKRENEEMELQQGEVIFHKPNEFHAIRAADSEPNFFVISFVCNSPSMSCFEKYTTKLDKWLRPYISAIIKEADKTFVISKNNPGIKKLIKRQNAVIGGEQLVKIHLEQLLILLIRNIQKIGEIEFFPDKASMENHLTAAVKKYLEENVEKNYKIKDISAHFGYSKSYLQRIFHEQTGASIASYGIELKIKLAKQLIREGNLNFTEISDKLSFDNPQYFSRVFKRIAGMTPTEFKLSLDFVS